MIENLSKVVPGRADMAGLLLLRSCWYTWIFDAASRRFRRVPRGAPVSLAVPAPWADYHHLEIEKSRFTVELDGLGTRLLRVSLHGEPCCHCRRDLRCSAAGDGDRSS